MFILAAALIVAGVALFVAAPLGVGLIGARAKSADELKTERFEHERALAVQGLRELEFDREMGKLSDADYEAMHKTLEDRALTAMAAIEKMRAPADKPASQKKSIVTPLPQAPPRPAPARRDAVPTLVLHIERPRPPEPPPQAPPSPSPQQGSHKIRFCPNCGMRANDARFCAQCGIPLKSSGAATARSE